MRERMFLFLTPDGVTYSSAEKLYPDVDNLQVLGWSEGKSEEDALNNFLGSNTWFLETDFREVICVEIVRPIRKSKRTLIKKSE
jgi:hypothetical protein